MRLECNFKYFRRCYFEKMFQVFIIFLLQKYLLHKVLEISFVFALWSLQLRLTTAPVFAENGVFQFRALALFITTIVMTAYIFIPQAKKKKNRAIIRNDFPTNIWKINQNKRIWKILTSACASELRLHSALPGCCPRSTGPNYLATPASCALKIDFVGLQRPFTYASLRPLHITQPQRATKTSKHVTRIGKFISSNAHI